ncbi:MAG: DUF4339 domain-containing protein [Actinomycetota bacterium]|nr:DUF4339 domain-containing protein [Actinomycetota bacterium]
MSDGWYVSRGGEVLGPFAWDRVVEYAGAGMIAEDDMVMRPGSDEWVRADAIPAFLAEAPATTTTPPYVRESEQALLHSSGAPDVQPLPMTGLGATPHTPPTTSAPAPRRGSSRVIAALVGVLVLIAAMCVLVSFVLSRTEVGNSGADLTARLGTWTSTTPGSGWVMEATSSADSPEEEMVAHIESDVEMVLDRVEGDTVLGTWRTSNTRVTVGGETISAPAESASGPIAINKDVLVASTPDGDPQWLIRGSFEGDRLQATCTYVGSDDLFSSTIGTWDLTRRP